MNDLTTCLAKDELKTIPFIDIIMPYTEIFSIKLEERVVSFDLTNKLLQNLLKELSFSAEIVLQEELNCFVKNNEGDFNDFVKKINLLLAVKYPVLDKILKEISNNFLLHIQNIFSNFNKDFLLIQETFLISDNIVIKDIDTSLGDGHGGEGTSLVTLSNEVKLIYKPRNIEITNSYNLFLDWVNKKLNINLKTIKCLSFANYGWLEFIDHEAVSSIDELKDYYHKAGVLLATCLLLGSKDCHYENIIASGINPVIIDHETIIQPVFSNDSITTWEELFNMPHFSVLESLLIVNQDKGSSLQYPGFGIMGNTEVMDMENSFTSPNTLDSKRDSRFIFRRLVKNNIPFYKNELEFVNNYSNSFIKGFSNGYDMFMNHKEELLSLESPVCFFFNKNIRYVWRPTFIYHKILKYLRGSNFMTSFEIYNAKMTELLSKAYQKNGFEEYKFILESEIEQMVKGNIPIFNLDSLDFHLSENNSFKLFQKNCIENIKQRVESLSIEHKNKQIEYINKWLET